MDDDDDFGPQKALPPLTSTFDTGCPACHQPIHVGDGIKPMGRGIIERGKWVHWPQCPDTPETTDEYNERTGKIPLCAACFLFHKGECL